MGSKRRPLTEQEKWICTVRWLNALVSTYFSDAEKIDVSPCDECPCFHTCLSVSYSLPFSQMVPTVMNFKVLERFTGPGSVVGVDLTVENKQFQLPYQLALPDSVKDINLLINTEDAYQGTVCFL